MVDHTDRSIYLTRQERTTVIHKSAFRSKSQLVENDFLDVLTIMDMEIVDRVLNGVKKELLI